MARRTSRSIPRRCGRAVAGPEPGEGPAPPEGEWGERRDFCLVSLQPSLPTAPSVPGCGRRDPQTPGPGVMRLCWGGARAGRADPGLLPGTTGWVQSVGGPGLRLGVTPNLSFHQLLPVRHMPRFPEAFRGAPDPAHPAPSSTPSLYVGVLGPSEFDPWVVKIPWRRK